MTTQDRLSLTIDGSQGALLRVLGTVERRGWQLRAVETERAGESEMVITLEVAPLPWHGGGPEVLRRHLAKLVCVKSAVFLAPVQPCAAPQAAAVNAPVVLGAVS